MIILKIDYYLWEWLNIINTANIMDELIEKTTKLNIKCNLDKNNTIDDIKDNVSNTSFDNVSNASSDNVSNASHLIMYQTHLIW